MKIEGNTIIFKSSPENYYKEREGLKLYTIRRITLWSEMREFEEYFDYFLDYLKRPRIYTHSPQIKIINSATHESFTRTISDISEFEGLWIISWRPEKRLIDADEGRAYIG